MNKFIRLERIAIINMANVSYFHYIGEDIIFNFNFINDSDPYSNRPYSSLSFRISKEEYKKIIDFLKSKDETFLDLNL